MVVDVAGFVQGVKEPGRRVSWQRSNLCLSGACVASMCSVRESTLANLGGLGSEGLLSET